MINWKIVAPYATAGLAGLLLLVVACQIHTRGRPTDLAAALTGEEQGSDRSSDQLDAEYAACRQLSKQLALIVRRLEAGQWRLAAATEEAQQTIHNHYPKYLRLIRTSYAGHPDQQTVAHYLLSRVVRDIGGTRSHPTTAMLAREYRATCRLSACQPIEIDGIDQ